ncbi:glycoside hydrolase [Achlya hypogyna]|uniref:glucan endo-1,3-beta-D-glucosidase n=1 Tax=Achlya hypogyna TaxID=1202772 RepID=A0A0A7CNW2_ACHHY|nr:secreted protein [Achlya hypogyna]OQR97957.1 glycoside hydrolase [Achlya hypogyna]
MLAPVLTLLASATVAALRGVCYDAYNSDQASQHFASIASRFDAVRTYQTWTHNSNLIDIAARNNLLMYPGIWLRGNGVDFNADVRAAVEGTKRNRGTVKAVFVGNEDLSNNWAAWQIEQKINQVRGAFRDNGLGDVKIGTVQTDGDWLNNAWLANVVDIVGVNIYPFFGSSRDSYANPVADLDARWRAMTNRFGNKVLLTETGWPDSGGNNGAHVSSWQNAQNYFNAAQKWMNNNGGEIPTWFMYHDNRGKPNYEGHFALAEPNGQWKFDFNVKSSNVGGGGGGEGDDKPSGYFQLITNRGKAFREWYGGVAAKDNNRDPYTQWTYNPKTQQLWNAGAQKCLDAYKDGNSVKVHVYGCDDNNGNQKWRLSKGKVIHAQYNVCLDADVNDPKESAQTWTCVDNNTNQIFKISK